MGKVILYTRQSDKTLNQLNEEGRFYPTKSKVSDYFGEIVNEHILGCYTWLANELETRLSKPEYAELPIWCAVRKEDSFLPIPGTVLYVLAVEKKDLIYFDDLKWDYTLNHMYLPESKADEESFKKHLSKLGLKGSYEIFEPMYRGRLPKEEKQVRESWKRIFDIDDFGSPLVRAFLWEINKSQVLQVIREGEEHLIKESLDK